MIKFKKFIKVENLFEKKYFGSSAVGVIIMAKDTGRILILKRSKDVFDGGTYSIVASGKVDENEKPVHAAKREIQEELDYKGKFLSFKLFDIFKDKNDSEEFDDDFIFYTYFAMIPKEFKPKLNWEHDLCFWWNGKDKIKGKVHFGTKRLLKKIKNFTLKKKK